MLRLHRIGSAVSVPLAGVICASTFSAADSAAAVLLDAQTDGHSVPVVHEGPSGVAAAAWVGGDPGAVGTLRVAIRWPGAAWEKPVGVADPTPAAVGGRPVPVSIRVAADGTPYLLWERVASARATTLAISTPTGPGTDWTTRTLATAPSGGEIDGPPALAVTTDGTVVAAWSIAAPTIAARGTDRLVVAVHAPSQDWPTAPTPITDEGQIVDVSGLRVDPDSRGGAIVAAGAWRAPFAPATPVVTWARWSPNGSWDRRVSALPEATPAVRYAPAGLTAGGGVQLLRESVDLLAGPRLVGERAAELDDAGRLVAPPVTLPAASRLLTRGGLVGAGAAVAASDIAEDGAAGSVVAVTHEPPRAPRDAWYRFGVPATWILSSTSPGSWRVAPLDPEADTSYVWQADLSRDSGGALVATWGSSVSGGPCPAAVFQSRRAADGTWSPRTMAALLPRCAASTLHIAGGPTPLVWGAGPDDHLIVADIEPPVATPTTFAPAVVTRTRRELLRGGRLLIDCAPSGFGICSASPIRAVAVATGKQRAALECLDSETSRTVGADAASRRIQLSIDRACLRRAGALLAPFTVRVTFDALGQPVQARDIDVKLR